MILLLGLGEKLPGAQAIVWEPLSFLDSFVRIPPACWQVGLDPCPEPVCTCEPSEAQAQHWGHPRYHLLTIQSFLFFPPVSQILRMMESLRQPNS